MSDRRMDTASVASQVVATFPVTPTQERWWYIDQLAPDRGASNIALRWELRGKVKADCLERAFAHVIERHEILRTRFAERDGVPVQEVMSSAPFHLGELDLRTTPQADRAARIDRIAMEEASRPFDLSLPCPLRATLVRFDTDRAMLLISVHHSVFDGWSIGVLGHEVCSSAAAYQAGREPELPELPLQYGDYALWLQEYMASGVEEREIAYWSDVLAGAPYIEFPSDKPRPSNPTRVPAKRLLDLPEGFPAALEARARAEGVTPFTFGAAVVSACLQRVIGCEEVVMATPVANRQDVDLEPLIGDFVNTVILRLDAGADLSMRERFRKVRGAVEGALGHQMLQIHRVVEQINPARFGSATPLASINFNLVSVFLQGRDYGDFELISVPSESPGILFDLNIVIIGRPSGWRIMIEYAEELYEAETIDALLELVDTGLRMALEQPELHPADLPVPRLLRERLLPGAVQLEPAVDASDLEQLLSAHPMVHEAAVIGTPQGRYGFVTPGRTGTEPLEHLPARLMRFVAEALEEAERPVGISVLSELPRNASGQVDRSALKPPSEPLPRLPVAQAAPSVSVPRALPNPPDATQEVLQQMSEIWTAVLPVRNVRPEDDFFDIGGHSLLVVRMLAQLRQKWSVELGIGDIYDNPTLAALSALVAARLAPQQAVAVPDDWRIVRVREKGQGTPFIAVNNAGLLLAFSRAMSAPPAATCVRLFDGTRGMDRSERDFEEIAAEYARLIREAQPEGPYLLFGLCLHGNIALEAARILQAEGHEVKGVIMKDVWEPGFFSDVARNRAARWQDRRHALRNRMRMVRNGTLSLSAALGNYRIIRATGILQLASALGLIDRVRSSDLEAEQEETILYIGEARDRYRPAPLDLPVLHVVTGITPQGGHFLPSIGWEKVVTGPLRTVYIDEVSDHPNRRVGIEAFAREIEDFLEEIDSNS